MCNFLKSWLLIMAQHVLFSAAEQNIIPIDRYGNITHERDSWSDWCTDTDTTMPDVPHTRRRPQTRSKRSTRRRQRQMTLETFDAQTSHGRSSKRSTRRRQRQMTLETFDVQTSHGRSSERSTRRRQRQMTLEMTATDDAGNVRRADDSHRRRCKWWRWYRRLTTLTRCPFKKQQ